MAAIKDSVQTMHHSTMKIGSGYRPDVDGLRAVAVITVLLYHVGFESLSGGFVGVDIFFVISGYLITRLLVNERAATGRIDLYGFYIRRLRRIYPALLTTLLITTAVASAMFTPQALEAYGGALFHTVYSVSNIYFFGESGYFDADSRLKPLLHTWSLGVEEQFYLVWPLFILLTGSILKKQYVATIAIGAISIIASALITGSNQQAAFFLMPFRVFEFSIGAALVGLERHKPKHPPLDNVLLLGGLAIIAFSVLSFNKHTPFPGMYAALPSIGAALCIYAGGRASLRWILSNRIAVGIGLISYSLYLVHWPIVVFYRYYTNSYDIGTLAALLIVLISITLATAMYFCIESRFRKALGPNRAFLFGLVFVTALLTYLGGSMWANDGWGWRPWMPELISLKETESGKNLRFSVRQVRCKIKGWDKCDDLTPGKVNALIVGDSHAPDALNAFAKVYPSHNFVMSTLGGCPPHRKIASLVLPSHPDLPACEAVNAKRYDEGYLRSFDYVVVNVLFGWYTYDHLTEYLDFLHAAGVKKVIVFGGYLTLTHDLPDLINRHGFSTASLAKFVERKAEDRSIKAATDRLGYLFVSKIEAFCIEHECELFDSRHAPFTYDSHHLSYQFASRMLTKMVPEVERYIDASTLEGHSIGSFKLLDWGPRTTALGHIPNQQPDGSIGFWVRFEGNLSPSRLELLVDGLPAIRTVLQDGLVTAAMDATAVRNPSSRTLAIDLRTNDKVIPLGKFRVTD